MFLKDEEFEKIASQEHIALTPEEENTVKAELRNIIEYISALPLPEELEGIPEYTHYPVSEVAEGAQRRRDISGPSPDRDEMLRNAPKNDEGYIIVPKTVKQEKTDV